MATKKNTSEVIVSEPADEPVYTLEELVAAAEKVFGVKPELAAAALKLAGIKEATKAEAEEIIKKFSVREVK